MTITPDHRTRQLSDTLREVLAAFSPMREVHGGPVVYYDGSADIEVSQFERWQAVLNGEVIIAAGDIVFDGGDVMLQELGVGDPVEIEKQTGPLSPGVWVITAFEADDRSRARMRRLATEEIQERRGAEARSRMYE